MRIISLILINCYLRISFSQYIHVERNSVSESMFLFSDTNNLGDLNAGFWLKNNFNHSTHRNSFRSKLLDYVNNDLSEVQGALNREVAPIYFTKNHNTFIVQPIFDGELSSGVKILRNSRGIQGRLHIGEKFSVFSEFVENQTLPYLYNKAYLNKYNTSPGIGYIKRLGSDRIDYFTSKAYISGNLLNDSFLKINVSFGHFGHKFGLGIRSLFLDANGLSPIGLRLFSKFGNKVNYTNYFSQMTGYLPAYGNILFPKKYLAIHRLGLNVLKNNSLKIGFFEGTMHSRNNGLGGFDLDYLNPVIFYRSVEANLGSADNALLGLDVSKEFGNFLVYNQFLLDEFKLSNINKNWWANKWAAQVGVRHIIQPNSNYGHIIHLEANFIKPYTYSHYNELNSYSNYNQGIAHPAGANLKEYLIKGFFVFPKLWDVFIDFTAGYRIQGVDSTFNSSSMGGVIFRSSDLRPRDFNVTFPNGIRDNVKFLHLTVNKMIFHKTTIGIVLDYYNSSFYSLNKSEFRFSLKYNVDRSDVIF